jgi:hypothetical protein
MHLQGHDPGLGSVPPKQLSTAYESPERIWPLLARVADAPGCDRFIDQIFLQGLL